MSLVAWYPLNNTIANKGTGEFNLAATPSFTSNGKTSKYCAIHSGTSGATSCMTSETLSLSNTSPISIACWVYMGSYASTGANLNGIISNHNHSLNSDKAAGFGLTLRNIGNAFQVSCSTPYGSTISGRTYSQIHSANTFGTGSWNHIAMVYDGTCIRLYLNGVEQTICYEGSSTGLKYYTFTATPSSNNPIGIFCWSTGYGDYSGDMRIQDARVYDHALSLVEIKKLSKALALHYSFEDLYKEVDYIESTGTQWIDTGIKPSTTLRGEIDLLPNTGYIAERAILGSTWSASGYFLMFYQSKVRFHSRNLVFDTSPTVTNSRMHIKFYSRSLTNNCLSVNKIDIQSAADYGDTSDSSANIKIFDAEQASLRGVFKLYSCKFYDGDTLIRDFIPVVRQTDGIAGLYDKINNRFYTNAGSGVFNYPEENNLYNTSILVNFQNLGNNTIGNTRTDTRTYFNFQAQTWAGSTFVASVINEAPTRGNRYRYILDESNMASNITRIRLKHNGSSADIDIGYINIDHRKSYAISFEVIADNPTGVNGIQIKDLIVSEIGTVHDLSGNSTDAYLQKTYNFSPNNSSVGEFSIRNVSGDSDTRINTTLNPSFINNGTIAFWYRKDSSAFNYNGGHFLVATQSPGNWFGATTDGAPFCDNCSYGTFYLDGVAGANSNVQDTNWHFYAYTGVNLSSWSSFSMQSHGDTSWLYRGDVADFKIYNSSLSLEEIKELYNTKLIMDKSGNLYCEKFIKRDDTIILPSKQGIISAKAISNKSSNIKLSRDYEEIDYVEFTGGQIINTGVTFAASGSLPIVIDAEVTPKDSTGINQCLAGCGNNLWNGPVMMNFCNNNLEFGTGGYTVIGAYTPNVRMSIKSIFSSNLQLHFKDGALFYRDTSKTFAASPCPLYIGDFNFGNSVHGNTSWKGKLHKIKIYAKNILVRDYIPVKRKSDGAVGVLDKVTGNFTAVACYYTELEYIESTGTQYINPGIGFVNGNSFTFEARCQYPSSTTTTGFGHHRAGISCTNGLLKVGYAQTSFNATAWNTAKIEWSSGNASSTLNQSSYVNGSLVAVNTTEPYDANPYLLFAMCSWGNSTGVPPYSYEKVRISNVKLYVGNIIKRDFVSVRRSDGVLGMYDKVTETFYTNSGSGTFSAGAAKSSIIFPSNAITIISAKNIYEGMGASVAPVKMKIF